MPVKQTLTPQNLRPFPISEEEKKYYTKIKANITKKLNQSN